jgi:hypothetical protein
MYIITIHCVLSPRFPFLCYTVSVPEVAKEAYEAAAEELYEMFCGCTLSYDQCAGFCQACHKMVGIDVVCAEHGEFAACLLQDLLPYLFPVLQLQHYRTQFRLGFYGTSYSLLTNRMRVFER